MRPMIVLLAVAICFLEGSPAPGQAPASPAPSFLLVGVIIPEAGEPKAVMEDPKTHEQEIYALGAQIGDARLTEILKDRVVLTSGDVAIEVRLAGPAPPPPPSRAVPFRPPPARARRVVPR